MKNVTSEPPRKISFPLLLSVLSVIISIVVLVLFLVKTEKSVYVNTGVLLEKYQGMADVRKKFESESKTWQSNIDTLTSDLQTAMKKYEKDQAGMSAKEKAMAQELLKAKQQQLGQYQQAIQNKARDEQSKLSEGALKQINSFIEQYGKGHHYKIVFGTSNGNIVYADKSIDITDAVLEGLNKEYQGTK
jgi:outer membrane protein